MKAVYFDDEMNGDASRLGELIESTREVECELLLPPKHLGEIANFQNHKPDLFLIDYDLNAQSREGTKVPLCQNG